MRLVHYSEFPIDRVLDTSQRKDYGLKPSGLWVSDEDDYGWAEWCDRNAPGFLGELSYVVELKDDANILYLRTVEDIDAFTYCYRMRIDSPLDTIEHVLAIDWFTLSQEYDGLIITPYQWKRRIGFPCVWYYGWDVASGCIWNSKAIKELKQI